MPTHKTHASTDEHFSAETMPSFMLEAIVLLTEGMPKTQISETLNISRDTLYSWLKRPDFNAVLEEHQRRVSEAIRDPTAYQAGLVKWKARLPDMMDALLTSACDPKNPRQTRAAELILKAVTPDKLNTGPTDDEKIIQEFLKTNGIHSLAAKQKQHTDNGE